MITLVDIKKSINQVLKTNFPDIKLYADEIKEGFERPSFFVQILSTTFDYDTTNYASNKLMIIVNYFSANGTQLENLKMHDAIKEAFGRSLNVNDRYLHLQNIRSDEADGALQFKFDLNYLDGIEKIDEHELMRELNLAQRGDI